jgi:hypothetical protein
LRIVRENNSNPPAPSTAKTRPLTARGGAADSGGASECSAAHPGNSRRAARDQHRRVPDVITNRFPAGQDYTFLPARLRSSRCDRQGELRTSRPAECSSVLPFRQPGEASLRSGDLISSSDSPLRGVQSLCPGGPASSHSVDSFPRLSSFSLVRHLSPLAIGVLAGLLKIEKEASASP